MYTTLTHNSRNHIRSLGNKRRKIRRMATGAADMMFRCVFDGSLSMCEMDIERRLYYRNCKCALHKVKAKCSRVGSQLRNVSFPKREFRNNSSYSVSASTRSSQSSYVHSSSTRSTECSMSVQIDVVAAASTVSLLEVSSYKILFRFLGPNRSSSRKRE